MTQRFRARHASRIPSPPPSASFSGKSLHRAKTPGFAALRVHRREIFGRFRRFRWSARRDECCVPKPRSSQEGGSCVETPGLLPKDCASGGAFYPPTAFSLKQACWCGPRSSPGHEGAAGQRPESRSFICFAGSGGRRRDSAGNPFNSDDSSHFLDQIDLARQIASIARESSIPRVLRLRSLAPGPSPRSASRTSLAETSAPRSERHRRQTEGDHIRRGGRSPSHDHHFVAPAARDFFDQLCGAS